MLENPVVSNSTRKSENLFGADNQQGRLVCFDQQDQLRKNPQRLNANHLLSKMKFLTD